MFRSDPRRRSRAAFTMIELLVVIVIIALLMALLVPALNSVREAARKLQCVNNLKGVAAAMTAYETRMSWLPYGCRSFQSSGGSSSQQNWGPSWWLAIMPDMDNKAMFDNWNFRMNARITDINHQNARKQQSSGAFINVAHQFAPAFMNCPSSPLTPTVSVPNLTNPGDPNNATLAAPHYAAICGSAPDVSPNLQVFDDATRNPAQGRNVQASYGICSGGGAFPPNIQVKMSMLATDGLSNMILVGEQSDWATDGQIQYDIRSTGDGGAFLGTTLTNTIANMQTTPNPATFVTANCTTVRYPINTKTFNGQLPSGILGITANTPTQALNGPPIGHNNGIFSCHSGAANVCFADGRAKSINDSIALSVLLYLCTRDDKHPIPVGVLE